MEKINCLSEPVFKGISFTQKERLEFASEYLVESVALRIKPFSAFSLQINNSLHSVNQKTVSKIAMSVEVPRVVQVRHPSGCPL